MGAGSLGRPPSSSALFEVSFARASKVSLFPPEPPTKEEAEGVVGRLSRDCRYGGNADFPGHVSGKWTLTRITHH